MKVSGKKIKVFGMTVDDLMFSAGYKKLKNGSYVYNFKEFIDDQYEHYRYHVYEIQPTILEIHTDLIKKRKKVVHIASRYTTKDEVKRIKSFLPKVEVIPKKKKKEVNKSISREELRKALEEMGDFMVKKLTWYERIIYNIKSMF